MKRNHRGFGAQSRRLIVNARQQWRDRGLKRFFREQLATQPEQNQADNLLGLMPEALAAS